MQLNAVADGDSHRTLEVIDPSGEVVRTYTFNQDGFISGSQEYLYGNDITSVAKDRKAPSGGKSRTREADDAAIFA